MAFQRLISRLSTILPFSPVSLHTYPSQYRQFEPHLQALCFTFYVSWNVQHTQDLPHLDKSPAKYTTSHFKRRFVNSVTMSNAACHPGSHIRTNVTILHDVQSVQSENCNSLHDDVIKWKHLPSCEGNPPVTSRFLSQRSGRRTLMFSLMCTKPNCWANNRDAGDLRRHRAHYDVAVIWRSSVSAFHQQTCELKGLKTGYPPCYVNASVVSPIHRTNNK